MELARITGSIRLEERRKRRVFVAAFITADGSKTRRVLGPAHAKDSGRRTPKGAVSWRAADGPKPPGSLTPKDAQEHLVAILRTEEDERARLGCQPLRSRGKTVGDALDAYLAHCVAEGRAETTVRGYSSIASKLMIALGESTPLSKIDGQRLRNFRASLLLARSRRPGRVTTGNCSRQR